MKKLVLLFLLIPVIGFSQEKLKQAKTNLSSRSNTTSTSQSSNNDNSGDDGSNDNVLSGIFAEIFLFVTYKAVFGDFQQNHFAPYPYYYDNVPGEYDYGTDKEDKKSLLRVGGNYLSGNTMNSIEANLNFRFVPLVGLDIVHQRFIEQNKTENDHLDISSFMLNYYRFRERTFTGWWGMGVTYVGNEVNTSGFTYQLGLEIYPVNPMSLHLSYKQSFINESHINLFKVQAKYHLKKMAFFLGYHRNDIATIKASGIALGVEANF